jgi:protein-disulfide isomerase
MTRRQRRQAQRDAQRGAERPRSRRSARPWWQNTGALTVGLVAVGIVLLGLFVLRPGSGTTTGELNPPVITIPAGLENDRTLGSPSAPVTIDVWADFQCPFCDQFATNVEPRIVTELVATGQAKLVAHDFAFIGQRSTPDESTDAAVAARCAGRNGKYWEYAGYLWANQGSENSGAFNKARLDEIASAVGLDVSTFDQCLSDQSVRSSVATETSQGASLGVNATPTIFVNGQKLATIPTYEQLATMVRQVAGSATPGALPSGSAPPAASPSASTAP